MNHPYIKFFLLFALCAIPGIVLGHDVTSADQQLLANGSLWSYIYVGAKHMVTGYDHLLFLTGVIFYLSSIRDIIKFITVFTIGHSITLIGATYLGITANEHLVDAVIALSVIYKGFENLDGFKKIFNVESPNLLLMVLIFGLIHGFGLSTRLQSFEMGSDLFLAKILCFNIGVELGQVLALIPIVFIIRRWKAYSSFNVFHKVVNYFLVAAGVVLFVFQIYRFYNPVVDHHHHEPINHHEGADHDHHHGEEADHHHHHGDHDHDHHHSDGQDHHHHHGDHDHDHPHDDHDHHHQ